MFDELLERLNLQYEELTPEERATFTRWMDTASGKLITVDTIRMHISDLKNAVEEALENYDNNPKHDLLLKARLKNYRLLEALLISPDKAKLALERYIGTLVSKKK